MRRLFTQCGRATAPLRRATMFTRTFSSADFIGRLENELKEIEEAGTWKKERVIVSSQEAKITVASGAHVLNFCANNYLGLSNDPRVNAAAKATIDSHGFGLSSVRFICGTQDIHIALEDAIAKFHKMDAAILYPSWYDWPLVLIPLPAILRCSQLLINDCWYCIYAQFRCKRWYFRADPRPGGCCHLRLAQSCFHHRR